MDRRRFFRSLVGAAPIAAVAKPSQAERVLAHADVPTCECGFAFYVRSAWMLDPLGSGTINGIPADRPTSAWSFMQCGNERCRHYGKPLALPTVALAPADPRVVAAVQESERLEREAKEREIARLRTGGICQICGAKHTSEMPHKIYEFGIEDYREWRGWEARQ